MKKETKDQTQDLLEIFGIKLDSRFLIGSAGYPSPKILKESILKSQASVVTMGVKRQVSQSGASVSSWYDEVKSTKKIILPNTAGCRTAKDAVNISEISREIFQTNWIKLEIVGDEYTLQPDSFEIVEATRNLVARGFEVFVFCTEDILVAERIVSEGCKVLMPWASPIGSGQGLLNLESLKRMRERFSDLILIVDAGIGAPSHASKVMEIGFDAVLLNSAVSQAVDPVGMAQAFSLAINAGRKGFKSGLIAPQPMAKASTQVGSEIF